LPEAGILHLSGGDPVSSNVVNPVFGPDKERLKNNLPHSPWKPWQKDLESGKLFRVVPKLADLHTPIIPQVLPAYKRQCAKTLRAGNLVTSPTPYRSD